MEKIIALIALAVLMGGFLLLVISVNRGKRIVKYIKRRYPQQWDELGKPAPGYLQSLERNRWVKFMQDRGYEQFKDPKLTKMGDAQRNLENITLGFVFAFILVGGVVAWFEWIG